MDLLTLISNNINPLVFIPAIIVFIASAIFVFGSKKTTETPKLKNLNAGFRTRNGNVSSSSQKTKKSPSKISSDISKKELVKKTDKTSEKESQPPSRKSLKPAATSKQNASVKLVSPSANVQKASGKQNKKATVTVATKSTKAKTAKMQQENAGINVPKEFLEDGEWQTVLTKKQKKQQISDPLIQAVAKVATNAAVSKKAGLKAKSSPTKSKNVKTAVKSTTPPGSVSVPIPNAASIVVPVDTNSVSAGTENISKNIDSVPVSVDSQTTSSGITPQSNLLFDELADTEWTESKPQKRTKRRALRGD